MTWPNNGQTYRTQRRWKPKPKGLQPCFVCGKQLPGQLQIERRLLLSKVTLCWVHNEYTDAMILHLMQRRLALDEIATPNQKPGGSNGKA